MLNVASFLWIARSWLSLRFSLTFILFLFLLITWHPPSPSRAFLFVTRYEQYRYVVRSIGIVTNTHFIRWRKPEYPNKTTFYNKWQIWLSSFRYNLITFRSVRRFTTEHLILFGGQKKTGKKRQTVQKLFRKQQEEDHQ